MASPLQAIAVPVAFLAALSASALVSRAAEAPVAVPGGTLVPILLDHDIDSGSGDKLWQLEVAEDVVVDGHVILQKSDTVDAHLKSGSTLTHRLTSDTTTTTLVIDVDRAISFCGDVVPLTFERTVTADARKVGGVALRHHSAGFDRGSVLAAHTVAVPQGVCSSGTHATPAPSPEAMIAPDGAE